MIRVSFFGGRRFVQFLKKIREDRFFEKFIFFDRAIQKKSLSFTMFFFCLSLAPSSNS